MKGWEKLTIETIRTIFEGMISEKDLLPYKSLGYGLYELPGKVICNKKGLNKYLCEIAKTYNKKYNINYKE